MSGDVRCAADTSFLIALLRGDLQSQRQLHEIAFPFAVAGELRFGALGGRDPQRQLAEIERLFGHGTILPADDQTATVYADLRMRLKTAGTPIPENDIWIAAICLQHDLTLLTLDRHFDRIIGLKLAAQ